MLVLIPSTARSLRSLPDWTYLNTCAVNLHEDSEFARLKIPSKIVLWDPSPFRSLRANNKRKILAPVPPCAGSDQMGRRCMEGEELKGFLRFGNLRAVIDEGLTAEFGARIP